MLERAHAGNAVCGLEQTPVVGPRSCMGRVRTRGAGRTCLSSGAIRYSCPAARGCSRPAWTRHRCSSRMGGLLQASTERLQGKAIPGHAKWTWRAGPAEPRCSSTEASVRTMRFGVGVAAVAQEIVEVACEARRGRFSARGRSPGSKLEIRVKGACVGDLPASPAATAAAAVQLCPQEESSVEEALFSLCVGGFPLRGARRSAVSTSAEALPPPVRPH